MHERVTILDAIRGVALFGILIVNIQAFSSVGYGNGSASSAAVSNLDSLLAFFVSAQFELKFYLLFSFLFGYSVTLQMKSAEKAQTSLGPRLMRRHAGLFLIGILHAVFLFHGDILTTYAVLGTVLFFLRPSSDKVKLWLALILTVGTAITWLFMAWDQWQLPSNDETALAAAIADQALLSWRGGPAEIIGAHVEALTSFLPLLLLLQMPCALAMFCMGFVAGKNELLQYKKLYQPYVGRVIKWGLIIGLPGAIFYASTTQFYTGEAIETVGLAISILTAPFLTSALLGALLLFFEQEWSSIPRDYLAAAGRMALSNYLLQSLVCALVFHGYGLGLINEFSIAQTCMLAVVIFFGQVVVSRWWLNRLRYGPVEWLLRALTIWAVPPFRHG